MSYYLFTILLFSFFKVLPFLFSLHTSSNIPFIILLKYVYYFYPSYFCLYCYHFNFIFNFELCFNFPHIHFQFFSILGYLGYLLQSFYFSLQLFHTCLFIAPLSYVMPPYPTPFQLWFLASSAALFHKNALQEKVTALRIANP